MKKILLLGMYMLSAFISIGATDHLLVSATQTSDFWNAFGWVFTFDVFSVGILLLPFIGKKIIHIFFVIFFVLALWVGSLIVQSYELNFIRENILFVLCFIPGVVIYGYSIFYIDDTDSIWKSNSQKHSSLWVILLRYSLFKLPKTGRWTSILSHTISRGIVYLLFPIIFCGVYVRNQLPRQRRKKYLKKLGWNVESPDIFPTYLILHRYKNPVLTCAVSRSWKHVPIHTTRSLGLLSLESQSEIESILEYLKMDFALRYEKNNFLVNQHIVIFDDKAYSFSDIISRIERKTPKGIRFLHMHMKKIMEESKRKI